MKRLVKRLQSRRQFSACTHVVNVALAIPSSVLALALPLSVKSVLRSTLLVYLLNCAAEHIVQLLFVKRLQFWIPWDPQVWDIACTKRKRWDVLKNIGTIDDYTVNPRANCVWCVDVGGVLGNDSSLSGKCHYQPICFLRASKLAQDFSLARVSFVPESGASEQTL